MLRFVILRHEMPPGSRRATHWDLMLEADGILRTWALDEELRVGASISATQLADHRLAYLDYEGPVSGNRGSVSRVEQGTFEWIADEPGRVIVAVAGTRLAGEMVCEQSGEGGRWKVQLAAL